MKIVKLDNYGRGITYDDEKIMFVENALIDEDIEVENIIDKKKYKEAAIQSIKEESKERVTPKCPYYYKCGGCNLMHMNYDYQEVFKLNKVKDILKKYADINCDIRLIKNDKQLFYRNKVSLKVSNKVWGYYSSKTHELVAINNCLIASNAINDIIKHHEFIKIINGDIILRSNYNNEILIIIESNERVIIDNNVPNNIKGIVVNDKAIYGDNYFYDYIDDLKFKVSYNSFFQVNNYMASRIFNILRNNLSGKNLLDLYCGVGTLGCSVSKKFDNIYGIEKIDNAIVDAKENAINNNIENANYFAGDTGDILNNIKEEFDTIIVDPPRSGLNTETLNYILNLKPNTLAYVSCDPFTLARDLNRLKEFYEIKKINVLEMFPNTYHVETIVILKKY